MARWCLIEFSTMAVLNVETNASPSPGSVPRAPGPGFRNIIDTDWAPDQVPAVNDIWNGQIPASFTTPAPIVADEIPGDLTAVNDRLTALQAEIDSIKAGVSVIQG